MADEQVVEPQEQSEGSTTTDSKQQTTQQTTDDKGTTKTSQTVTGKQTEDPRYAGMLRDLQAERTKRQEWERKATEREVELASERRRVQALAGVNPLSPEEADAAKIRTRIKEIMGEDFGTGGLTKEEVAELRELRSQAAELRASSEHHWQVHGQQMLSSVVSSIAKQLGGELSERQTTRIQRAYVQEAESNPEFLKRHEQGDPKLIEEFVKDFMDDFIEPARRLVTKNENDRMRRVPGSRDRSVVGTSGKKVDLSTDKGFADALVDSYKGHGGAFGD